MRAFAYVLAALMAAALVSGPAMAAGAKDEAMKKCETMKDKAAKDACMKELKAAAAKKK